MYLPPQDSGALRGSAGPTGVMDPLRYPVHNGELLPTTGGLSSIDEEELSIREEKSPNSSSSILTQRSLKAVTNLPLQSSTSILSPLGEVSSSSTDPSNVTVLNINSSSGKSGGVSKRQPSDLGSWSSDRSKQEVARTRRERPPITKLINNQVPQKHTSINKPQDSVAEFASSLTNALLETKDLETVDLNDSTVSPDFIQQHFNDLSMKTCSPCDDDSSEWKFNPSDINSKEKKRLPKTPAPSVDHSGFISSQHRLERNKMSFPLHSLDFSLPESTVYEPEPVDFPSSPGALRASASGLRLAEEEEEGGIVSPCGENDCVYSAVASPPDGLVAMRKTVPSASGSGQQEPKTYNNLDSRTQGRRKKLSVRDSTSPNDNFEDDHESLSSLDDNDEGDDVAQMLSQEHLNEMLTPDDINTPDELEESIMERLGPNSPDHPGRGGGAAPDDSASFRAVVIQGIERRIDMQVIEPYKKVLSHGGHLTSGEAIIVFSACFLPDRARHDYDYVMDHLFMYVLTALDQLIAEDYVLVYLHGATTRANMPSFSWLKRCYQMIDRRLRKNLQALYLVHPTFWVKTVVVMIRPFVSAKFSRKLRFVDSLRDLSALIPMEQVCIPSRIKQYDDIRESLLKKEPSNSGK